MVERAITDRYTRLSFFFFFFSSSSSPFFSSAYQPVIDIGELENVVHALPAGAEEPVSFVKRWYNYNFFGLGNNHRHSLTHANINRLRHHSPLPT